ncbi:hypothetical protein [Pseudoalteromonas sp. 68 DY56-GL68]|uniref:hypothetical protein n=1 Tax=Pseudoalteromonas sp. 68 DY56-GL68 TaxID=2974919 RepID=UPI00352B09C2|tara:strand:- start:13 stop:330 length:318 start_codon:yes stop_codon:yes gene_type:complete
MSWWDSIVETAGDLYDNATDYIGEQYNGYLEYQKTVQSEAQKDTDALRQNEPVKGQLVDGSPVVSGTTGAPTQGQPFMTQQLIAGVDNKWLVAGGVAALFLLMRK